LPNINNISHHFFSAKLLNEKTGVKGSERNVSAIKITK